MGFFNTGYKTAISVQNTMLKVNLIAKYIFMIVIDMMVRYNTFRILKP